MPGAAVLMVCHANVGWLHWHGAVVVRLVLGARQGASLVESIHASISNW